MIRFGHCLVGSMVVHVALLLGVSVGVVRLDEATRQAQALDEGIEVRMLDEPPIIEMPPVDALPAGPIFLPSQETLELRAGMGAVLPQRVPRRPGEAPTPVRGPAPNPDPGAPAPRDWDVPATSEPDAFEWDTHQTPDGVRRPPSEAVGGQPGSETTTRLTPDGPVVPDHAPPSAPGGDSGVGTGEGGMDATGAGPAPAGGGSGPAPTGPGDGASGAGTGGGGPGGEGGTSPAGGSGTGGPRKPARAGSGGGGGSRGEAAHTPPFPRSREMQRLGIHGTVQLRLTVNGSGDVTGASVTRRSGYPEYDDEVAQWVSGNWRYPGGKAGSRTVSVSF